MAVRKIIRMGDSLLLEPSSAVQVFDTPELHALVQDLMDTMRAEDGAGLAAPQIGVLSRVVIFGFEDNPRYPGRRTRTGERGRGDHTCSTGGCRFLYIDQCRST